MKDPAGPSSRFRTILGWFPEVFQLGSDRVRNQFRLLALAGLVGIVSGVGAIVFYVATRAAEHYALGVLAGYYPEPRPGGERELPWLEGSDPKTPGDAAHTAADATGNAAADTATAASASPDSEHPLRLWLLILIPAVGGLLSGVLVFTVAPEAEGHGTDSAIDAYHHRQGQIRPRVPVVKMVASAITLGTGGSGGREGPIAQIGAGFGSLLANVLHLRPAERRVLMAAGMGSGIGAIFRAPLAGTMFAAEVLYSSPEFEPEVIMPTGIASVVSYCIFGAFSGWEPLFTIPDLHFNNPLQLGPYLLLALLMVVMAMLYTRSFYGCKRLFERMPIRRHFRPAIGAAATGVVAVSLYLFADYVLGVRPQQVLSVLAFGYSAIQEALRQDTGMLAVLLLLVAFGKIATTSLTIGSGGSGGVFGPAMVIGGCSGGALGIALHNLSPSLLPHPASFVIVGMAGFFAAAAKTPFSTLIIVSEMTGGYSLLLPALWVCTLSFILSDKQSIYASQVETRSRSPAHQGSFLRQVLAEVHVSAFLGSQHAVISVQPSDPLATVLDRLSSVQLSVLPVVDGDNRLLGVVNLEEVHLAAQTPSLKALVVAEDLMRSDVRPLTPEVTLDRALELFVENDLPALPVVADMNTRQVVAMVRRFDIASAYLRHIHGPRTPAT